MPTDLFPTLLEVLARRNGWLGFCALLHRSGLAPLAYRRLQYFRTIVPVDVLEWLRVQHYQCIGRNLFLLEELRVILEEFDRAGIEAMVVKGHALARHTQGLTRVFGDLDILVAPNDILQADRVLAGLGYRRVDGQHHPFHYRYVRERGKTRTPVEVHWDLSRKNSLVRPDIAAIWSRSVLVSIFGLKSRVPDLTDHLLLLMLQLPSHHWALRLFADLGQVIWERSSDIDWARLQESAVAWGMRALAGSALYIVASELKITLPEGVRTCLEPENYLQRAQWRIARAAVAERLSGRDFRISRVARYVFLGHWEDIPSVVVRSELGARRWNIARVAAIFNSLAAAAALTPEILTILLKSLAPVRYDGTDRASWREYAVRKKS